MFNPYGIPLGQIPNIQQIPQIPPMPLGMMPTIQPAVPIGFVNPVNSIQPMMNQPILSSNSSSDLSLAQGEAPKAADEESKKEDSSEENKVQKKNEVPLELDKNYNLDNVLADAIFHSAYFRSL